jgi:hypothetical protein
LARNEMLCAHGYWSVCWKLNGKLWQFAYIWFPHINLPSTHSYSARTPKSPFHCVCKLQTSTYLERHLHRISINNDSPEIPFLSKDWYCETNWWHCSTDWTAAIL